MNEFDDDFLLRPGRVRSDRGGAGRGFLGQVRRATQKAAGGGMGAGRSQRGRAAAGSGRGLGRGGAPANARRVAVVGRIVRHSGSRYRAAPLARHIAYLERDGVTQDGERAHMFDAQGDAADIEDFAARCEPDRHHFRFIVSPADAGELADLRAFTRDLMRQAEVDLDTRLDWVAVDHWNTDNPHVHVLVRGKADDGRDLVISGDYIGRGLRERAQALATLELGPRSEREMAAALEAEVSAERLTSLDRGLRRAADRDTGVVDLRSASQGSAHPRLLIARAQVLERLGLAQEDGPGRWRLATDLEDRLRDLSERGDVIKTLHRAMARNGMTLETSRLSLHDQAASEPIAGRLVERGLRDELAGTAYAIVDGVDGRQHHLPFASLEETGDGKPGSIVELRVFPGKDGFTQRSLATRSDLPLEAQVNARGATWLDRQLLGQDIEPGVGGFGQEVGQAVARRAQVLVDRGLARRRGDVISPAPGLLARLRTQDLAAVSANLAAETGLVAREAKPGDAVAGVYRRRLDLASGRFAMIDDGLGFQLVPWRPSLEGRLGQAISGVATPGGVDWTMGRTRGRGPAL